MRVAGRDVTARRTPSAVSTAPASSMMTVRSERTSIRGSAVSAKAIVRIDSASTAATICHLLLLRLLHALESPVQIFSALTSVTVMLSSAGGSEVIFVFQSLVVAIRGRFSSLLESAALRSVSEG